MLVAEVMVRYGLASTSVLPSVRHVDYLHYCAYVVTCALLYAQMIFSSGSMLLAEIMVRLLRRRSSGVRPSSRLSLKLLRLIGPEFTCGLLWLIRPDDFQLCLTMSAELMELKFVRRPSVRPSVSQLSLNLMHQFLSNFGCCFTWAMR